VDREKQVVADEIRDLMDSPSDYIDERLASLVWRNNTLGFPISGTVETIANFTSRRLRARLRKWYRPENMVMAAAGNLHHDHLTRRVQKAFRFSKGIASDRRRSSSLRSSGQVEVISRKGMQLHLCLGGLAYPYGDPRKYALLILNTVLGEGMSSRLFQNLREHRGLAYAVHSYLGLASDTGLFGVYLATEPNKGRQALEATVRELDLLRERGLRDSELEHAKAQLKGHLMLGLESMSARMVRLAQQEILLGRMVGLDETTAHIEAVTADQVHAVAVELFQRKRLSLAAIGPVPDRAFGLADLQA
jgi:predicted Zn-dependent peptidase